MVTNFFLLIKISKQIWSEIETPELLSYVSDFKFAVGLHLQNGMVKNPKCDSHPQAL